MANQSCGLAGGGKPQICAFSMAASLGFRLPRYRVSLAGMRIPLEDDFADVIGKAQRGLGFSDEKLAARAGIAVHDLLAVKGGKPVVAVIRRIARHLKLSPDALEVLALRRWYPLQPVFPRGFAMFNSAFGGGGGGGGGGRTVNSYLVWDPRSREAAAFDTGADCSAMLDTIAVEKLRVRHLFLTHTHEDHIADLRRLAAATGAGVWSHERERIDFPGARNFSEGAWFHVGDLAVKTLLTSGHSPGLTTFYVTGASWPLAVCGDSIFASSMGGSLTHYADQLRNNVGKILPLPRDTVLAPGHGPLSTLAQEKKHNPFFAS
ncbi:MAG: MBL fold metallo-hydrolase [Opitutaceae bacterium]|jgi:glyoxylase-like metal-dependent hydrolase (beta-lactamase superfamily II)|nr:MBL fold metallo-hydrolase [Opitutaceae bacterium]